MATIPYPDPGPRAETAEPRRRTIRLRGRKGPTSWLLAASVFVLFAAACGRVGNPQGWAAPQQGPDGILYASTTPGKLAALDTKNFPGTVSQVWIFPPNTDAGNKLKLQAIYGAPLIDNGVIYFGGYDGKVYAVKTKDGSEAWPQPFDTGDPVIGGAALSGDKSTLFIGSNGGNFYGLDSANGSVKAGPFNAGSGIMATPLVQDSVVYVATVKGKLYALDAKTLAVKWMFSTDAGLLTDPVGAGSGTILVGGIDDRLHALDSATGQEKWSLKAGNWFWGRPLIDSGTAYVPNLDGQVFAIDISNGGKKWTFATDAPVRAGPILAKGTLVVIDNNGNAYFLDPASGDKKREASIQATVHADPLLLGDKVLVVSEGGDLHSVDPADGSLAAVNVQVPQ